jgi:hypothetical protein
LHPQGYRRGSQRCADRRVTTRRKSPVERRPQIVDSASVIGQPLSGGPHLHLGFGPLEEVAVIFGVATRDCFQLAAFGKLLEAVGAHRVEQTITYDSAFLRRDE